MTHYKTLIDTQYLGQWDLPIGRDVPVIIESAERYKPDAPPKKKKLPDGTFVDEPNKRLLIRFRGKKKGWLAGPVSQAAIASMYGPHVEKWTGKPITLYVDTEIRFGRTVTGGVRVRPTPPRIGQKPTDDPLDRPVDEAKAEQISRAKEGLE